MSIYMMEVVVRCISLSVIEVENEKKKAKLKVSYNHMGNHYRLSRFFAKEWVIAGEVNVRGMRIGNKLGLHRISYTKRHMCLMFKTTVNNACL